jgi:hypothetical protein
VASTQFAPELQPDDGLEDVFSVSESTMPPLRSIMQFILSISLLGAALYVIVAPAAPAEGQKWAPGVIGTLIGYWLRGR